MTIQYTVMQRSESCDTVIGAYKTEWTAKMQLARVAKKNPEISYFIVETDESYVKGMEVANRAEQPHRVEKEEPKACEHIGCSIVDGRVICDDCGEDIGEDSAPTPKKTKRVIKNGPSKTTGACATVWNICEMDTMKNATRKEVVDACIKVGVNPATARTQYQAWFTAKKSS